MTWAYQMEDLGFEPRLSGSRAKSLLSWSSILEEGSQTDQKASKEIRYMSVVVCVTVVSRDRFGDEVAKGNWQVKHRTQHRGRGNHILARC